MVRMKVNQDFKDGMLMMGIVYIGLPLAIVVLGFVIRFFIDLVNPPKTPNEPVQVNSSIMIEEGYDVSLSDDDSGFMYINGVVKNNGKPIEATDLELTFDVFSGDELVGQCFMTNPKDIESNGIWRMGWDALYSRCITEADMGKDVEVDSAKYSDYTLGNKQYFDNVYKY